MRIKRIIISILLAVCVCVGFCLPVYADTVAAYPSVGIVSPLYDIANRSTSDLAIIGTKADCKSFALGENVATITIEQTLQKYSGWFWIWNNVDGASWSRTVNKSSISLTAQRAVLQAASTV